MIRTVLLLILTTSLCGWAQEKVKSSRLAFKDNETQQMKNMLSRFEFTSEEFSFEKKLLKTTKDFDLYEVSFASDIKTKYEENNTVWCKYWLPKVKSERISAVVVVHYLGGSFLLIEKSCESFARNNIAALLIWLPFYEKRMSKDLKKDEVLQDANSIVDYFTQAVKDIRRARDFLASQREINSARISLYGVSMGAIIGCLAYLVDQGFDRCVLVGSGGNIAQIIFHDSRETHPIKTQLESRRYDVEKTRAALKEVEPLTYAQRAQTRNILMINLSNDEIIPKDCTNKLRQQMGSVRIKWFTGGHYFLVLYTPVILKDSQKFISKTRWY